jgi:2-polyprenyl-6-methoxyphenol hydroxylase-like FAD-dependent oxidoreductase
MSERTTCAVIGGGPAGMVLGLLLARAGIEVTVLEKHGDFLRDFRGDTVHPSTLQLLDELGLGERFAALPHSELHEVAFPFPDGRRLVVGDLSRLRTAHPYIAMVPQWDLLNLLADAAAEEPTFTLRMHAEATGLVQEAGRVQGVRYRTEDGATHELRADLTVACDGRWSLARAEAGLRPKELPVPIDVWWFRLSRKPGDGPAAITPVAGNRRVVLVIPREDFLQLAYLGAKGSDAQLRERGVEAFRRDVVDAVPWLADRVAEIESMDQVKHLDVRLNRLDRWHRDGLLCLGDAAHAMSPMGGVGINLAVQDAVAAATLLAGSLARGRVTPGELARVRRRRLLPTIAAQTLQSVRHRTLLMPILRGERQGPPKPVQLLLEWFPAASFVPAYLIGIGLRPEHAPAFARRPATGVRGDHRAG